MQVVKGWVGMGEWGGAKVVGAGGNGLGGDGLEVVVIGDRMGLGCTDGGRCWWGWGRLCWRW